MRYKIVSVLLVMIIISNTEHAMQLEYDHRPPVYSISNASSLHHPSRGPRSSSSSDINHRVSRDADINTVVEHATVLSHLVNGIYIQSGLMDGSIPIEKLVEDLLDFGSVKVSDITKFKADGITEVAGRMTSVQSALKEKTDVIELEKEAVKFNKIRKDYASINFDNIFPSQEQFSAVTKVDTSYLTNLDTVKLTLNLFSTRLSDINSFSSNLFSPFAEDQFMSAIGNLAGVPSSIDSEQSTFEDAAKKFLADNSWLKAAEAFKPLETVINIANSRKFSSTSSTAGFSENVKGMVDLVQSLTSFKQEIKVITTLAVTRNSKDPRVGNFSYGFIDGIKDLQTLVSRDVRGAWIKNVVGGEDSILIQAFQPLVEFSSSLKYVDDTLAPLSLSSEGLALLQNLALLPDHLVDSDPVMIGYKKCAETNYDPSDLEQTEKFVKGLKSLRDMRTRVSQAVGMDLSGLIKEMNEYVKSLQFTKEPKELAAHIKSTSDLKNMKKRVEDVLLSFVKIDGTDMKSEVLPGMLKIAESTSLMDEKWSGLSSEKNLQTCLNAYSVEGDQLAQIVEVIQQFRSLDFKQIDGISSAATSIAQTSKELSALESIPETMKSVAKPAAIAINKFPNSGTHHKTIGQIVKSLNYVYQFKEQQSSFYKLNDVVPFVQNELDKINLLSDRKVVEDQWGDQKAWIGQLWFGISSIKELDEQLTKNPFNSIWDFGRPLGYLIKVSDVKINAKEKLKALGTLMKTADQANVRKFEEAQKVLVDLSHLDLGFSAHHSLFHGSEAAFSEFFVFMKDYGATDHNAIDEPITVPLWVFLLSVTVFIIILVLFLVGAHYIRKKMMNDKVLAFFLSIRNMDYSFVIKDGEKLMGDVEETGSTKADRINDWSAFVGDQVKCPDGMVFFPSSFTFPCELWRIIMEADSDVMILVSDSYNKANFTRFFATRSKGKLKIAVDAWITTVSDEHDKEHDRCKYVIRIDKEKCPPKTVTIFTVPHRHGLPDHQIAHEQIQKAKKMTKKPILIECFTGMDEAMTVIGFHYCSEFIKRNKGTYETAYESMVVAAKNRRLIIRPLLVHWLLLGILYFLAGKNRDYMEIYKEQLQRYMDENRDKAAGDEVMIREIGNEEEEEEIVLVEEENEEHEED